MLDKYSNKQKLAALWISFPVVFLLVYIFSLKATVGEWLTYQGLKHSDLELRQLEGRSAMVDDSSMNWSRDLVFASEEAAQREFLQLFTEFTAANGHVQLNAMPELISEKREGDVVELIIIADIQGPFRDLLKLINEFERNAKRLSIHALSFDRVADRRNKSEYLKVKLYVKAISYG